RAHRRGRGRSPPWPGRQDSLGSWNSNSQLAKGSVDVFRPAVVRQRTGRAWVKDPGDGDALAGQRSLRPALGESSYADQPAGLPQPDQAAQRLVAGREERLPLGLRQLVGREVSPGGFHEDQRAVIEDEEAGEEALGGLEMLLGPAPDPGAAHLRAGAVEA